MADRIFVPRPNENWVVDRLIDEFLLGNRNITTTSTLDADCIWLFAGWIWNQFTPQLLLSKKVLLTVHHVVPEKMNIDEFKHRDQFVDAYHVPNVHTRDAIIGLTKRPIHVIPYWANKSLWTRSSLTKQQLREKYGIPQDAYIYGSFCRDTEGSGIPHGVYLPKLEKGPDLLADYLELENKQPHDKALHVVLAGWRRQYIIERLEKAKIPYTYFELPPQETLCELYQTLDVYPITARYEGGPQALIECGLLDVPVVSRHVGIADIVLPECAIAEKDSNDLDGLYGAFPMVPNVEALKLPGGFKPYRELLRSL